MSKMRELATSGFFVHREKGSSRQPQENANYILIYLFSREKQSKCDLEKQKRKVEGDLRLAQESLDQLDRERKEAEVTLCRKNKEIAALAQKLEREQSNVIKYEKQIKECGVGHFA